MPRNIGFIFANVQICVAIAAAIGYGCAGDLRRCIYWAAAAVLTASVTY